MAKAQESPNKTIEVEPAKQTWNCANFLTASNDDDR